MSPRDRPRAAGRRRAACAGQALLPTLALALLVLLGAGALTVVGAGHVAGARAQRVADLAALSAVRVVLARPDAAVAAGDRRAVGARIRRVLAPVLADDRARLESLDLGDGPGPPSQVRLTVAVPGPMGTVARAEARAGLHVEGAGAGIRGWARGGGYSGPLVYRDGKPICPAVAAAFDLMDLAARSDGIDLVVVSGFRSDAEQAVLFARHPDPRWVAPPGHSRHRDATELDLGIGRPAWRWLAANAGRFGFVLRYSWEPWHYGFAAGCGASPAAARGPVVQARPAGARRTGRGRRALWGDARPAAGAPGAASAAAGTGAGLPGWVPAGYRGLIATSAQAHGVPPILLAALLQAESGFRPDAVSPVGAQGIAQFMPATAAGMGLRNPFDPAQAIPAAARLLGGHLRRFGSVPLALAAYNAGPGAVERYGGVPPYRETQGYVARITALAGGAAAPPAVGAGWGVRAVLLPLDDAEGA